uniref:Uncharacterized protein n=1 Tax=Anguilla anguilla TaxID=7936 RepID=A0A0E9WDT7_ANGAN
MCIHFYIVFLCYRSCTVSLLLRRLVYLHCLNARQTITPVLQVQ